MTHARAVIREEVTPLAKSYQRSGPALAHSLDRLDSAWTSVRQDLGGDGPDRLRPRETAAALAAARWALTAARSRTETRGIHRRSDFPALLAGPVRRVILHGTDQIRIEIEDESAALVERAS